MNYFAIERNGNYQDHIMIQDNETNNIVFENYLNMTYDEMVSQDDIEEFVVAIMDIMDAETDGSDDQTIITLIGDDDIFIWSILMGTVDDDLRYLPIDWKANGKKYRYEN